VAVGKSILSGKEMEETNKGVAVKLRQRVKWIFRRWLYCNKICWLFSFHHNLFLF
jgi:hypothetical protein